MPVLKAQPVVPFNPLSLLGGAPSFQGGDAAPAVSDADSGNIRAVFSAPFVVGEGNEVSGGRQGALGSTSFVALALIAGVAWIIAKRR